MRKEMRKFIVLSLLSILIMAFSATVNAQNLEFKASGYLDIQSYWFRNIPTTTNTNPVDILGQIYGRLDPIYTIPHQKAYDRTNAYMGSRGRLQFDAVMGKELSGTIYFEMDSNRWGDIEGSSKAGSLQKNTFGYWTADRAAIEIKNVYIDFGTPYIGIPAPITVRVGLQPLAIRPNMVVYTDGMGITAGIRIDPVTIAPLWFKALEGKDASADDADVYGLHVIAKLQQFTIGGYGLYYNMNTYPFNFVTETYGSNPTNQADMWWWGVYTDGKLGPVDFNFDLVFDRGKVVKEHGTPAPDVKYSGWATRIKVDYPWEKFNFGVVGMYASGADARKTSTFGFPGDSTASGTLSTKVSSYVIPPGSEEYGGFFEGVGLFYPSWVNNGNTSFSVPTATTMVRGAVGGSWMVKLYGSYKVAPIYKITLQGIYIGDTTKHGNTAGTAVKTNGQLRDDKTIGLELGLIHEIFIYKNLKWNIGAGILLAGDALDYKMTGVNANDSPKNPWIITSRLVYNF